LLGRRAIEAGTLLAQDRCGSCYGEGRRLELSAHGLSQPKMMVEGEKQC